MAADNVNVAKDMIGLIRDLIIEELNKRDSTEICQIAAVNSDGTYHITIPPDDRNIVRNVVSISPDELKQGDYAYIYKFLGKLNNAIILTRIGSGTSLRFITKDELPASIVSYSSGGGGGDSVAWGDITGKPDFKAVSWTANYNDLINKPVIPSAQVNSDWNATSGVAQILNKPSIENGTGTNAIQEKMADATVDFTGRNPNAEALDSTLSAVINTGATGNQSVALNKNTMALATASMTNGNKTVAKGEESHAEGYQSVTLGDGSHAEGERTTAASSVSHSEGSDTIANAIASHAEGVRSQTKSFTDGAANGSHAEGESTLASGYCSHTEGLGSYTGVIENAPEYPVTPEPEPQPGPTPSPTVQTGNMAHAEGNFCRAIGIGSHAEGYHTQALHEASHTSGVGTKSSSAGQTVIGSYNADNANALFIIGNGSADNARSNAFTVTLNGTVTASTFVGNLTGNATYANSAGSATSASTASIAQQANLVHVNPDSSYVGAILVNSNNNQNTIVRKDNITVTQDGRLTVAHDPTNNMDVATKQYVDSNIPDETDLVHKTGTETITGVKTFGNYNAGVTSHLLETYRNIKGIYNPYSHDTPSLVDFNSIVFGTRNYYATDLNSYKITLASPIATANRTLTLPDATGTIAIDENVVHKTGTEVIGGDKTFSLGGYSVAFHAFNNNNQHLYIDLDNGGGDGSCIRYDDFNLNNYHLYFPRKSGTLLVDANVPNNQAHSIVVYDALHNISGKTLSAYSAVETTLGGYSVIIIKTGSSATLTEEQARSYMAAQTGSTFLPVYDYDHPTYSYLIFADGSLYKPQYDSTNGLVLYYMNKIAFDGDVSVSQTVLPGTATRPATTTTSITVNGVTTDIKSYTTIDTALSSSSRNPVANSTIYNAVSNKVDAEDFQELEEIALTTRGVLSGEPLTPVLSITDGAYYPTVSNSNNRWRMAKSDDPTFFKIYDVSNYTSVHLKSVSRAGHILTNTIPSDFSTKVHQNPSQVSSWYEYPEASGTPYGTNSEQANVLPKTGYTPYDKDLTTNGKHYLIVYEVNAAQAIEVVNGGGYSPITTSMFVNDGDGTTQNDPYAKISDITTPTFVATTFNPGTAITFSQEDLADMYENQYDIIRVTAEILPNVFFNLSFRKSADTEASGLTSVKYDYTTCANNNQLEEICFQILKSNDTYSTISYHLQLANSPVTDVQTSDGTSIVNNTIATLPGLYAHNIEIIGSKGSRTNVFCTLITSFATSFDLPSFIAYINNMSVAGTNPGISATGTVTYNRAGGVEYCRTAARVAPGVAANSTITLVYHNAGDAAVTSLVVGQGTGDLDLTSLTDAVVQIM